uniref:Proline-rich nuclear receptor coactivator 1 n=1 Tax=Geotrypetes seraphini TaxID=260995 RepID=A0A6P8Q581_GEOSA|nr:proline-rich nuclear receptor coactivator 1 [Geotrypetes seraphini]
MVTGTAPLFSRIPLAEDWGKRHPPPALLQRLLEDSMNEKREGSAPPNCPKRPGIALKKARRRKKGKRSPAGLLPARYHCHPLHQHRPGLAKRSNLDPGQGGPQSRASGVEHVSPRTGSGSARTIGEQPAGGSAGPDEGPPRAAQYKQLRKEVLKAKMGKLEKMTTSHNHPGYSIQRCEQPSLHKQKNKCCIPLIKVTSAKGNENNCWQNTMTFEMLQKQKNPLNNTENFMNMKLKNSVFLNELGQKEKNYAGAKFSDPPSPSVLPKPPSHWVGGTIKHSDQSRELMAVHLKTLLKVQA